MPEDCAIWRAALLTGKLPPGQIYYDVAVGQGRPVGHITAQKYAKACNQLTLRRIDAIIKVGADLTVVEITKSAGLTAVGQLITYPILYASTFGMVGQIKPLLVTTEIQPDIETVLAALRIPVILIPAAVLPEHAQNAQQARDSNISINPMQP